MADEAHQEKPVSLFYSYSHHDEELRRKLEDHLAGLRWNEMITDWHDRNIDAGEEWAEEIDRNPTSADVILLLVSASFIDSKYCWSIEMRKALERHEKGEAIVIPVILPPCFWRATPFAKLQAVPTDAKPVTSWSDPDEALYDVARKIERAVADLQQQRRRAGEKAQEQTQEARKRAEAKTLQAVEEQKRDAQQRGKAGRGAPNSRGGVHSDTSRKADQPVLRLLASRRAIPQRTRSASLVPAAKRADRRMARSNDQRRRRVEGTDRPPVGIGRYHPTAG